MPSKKPDPPATPEQTIPPEAPATATLPATADSAAKPVTGQVRVQVILAKPHTHAGREYPARAKIHVRPEQVQWLQEQGAIEGVRP